MSLRLKLNHVLIVDDNEDDYLIVRDLLDDVAEPGMEAEWTSDYEEARNALRQNQYDVCLLDHRLGGCTGLELLQELTQDCTTPVILLTGVEDHQVDVAAARAGASDYLVKNHINGPLLERSIRYAIQRKESELALLQAQRFAQATVDALPDNIAVLDGEGVITAVNRAWLTFAEANGFVGATHGVGSNYLTVCEASNTKEGQAIASGIRAVMAGEEEMFCIEYPCHTPSKKQWFDARVTRFSGKGPLHIVVAHEDITARKLAEAQLWESQANLAQAQQIARLGSWELDLTHLNDIDSNSLRWSDQVFRIFGFEPRQIAVSNENFFRAVHPDDRERIRTAIAEAIQNGGDYSIDHRIILPDSTERVVHEQSQIIYDPISKEPLKMVGTLQDITEQKRHEEELRQSNELLRAITEGTSDAIFAKDLEGRYLMINSAGAQALGVGVDDAVGRCDSELVSSSAAQVFTETDNRVIASGTIETHEETIMVDGEMVTYLTTKGPLRGTNGDVVGIVGVSRDITQRKQTEEALRMSQERFEILSRATNDVIWDWNLSTDELWWNEGFRTLFGYKKEGTETLQNSWKPRIHPDDREEVHEGIQAVLKSGQHVWSGEYRFLRADGSYTEIFDRGFVIHDAEGQPIRMVGSMQDISERKQAENALRESEARSSAVIEYALDCIITIDHRGRVVEFNPAAEATFGYTRAESLGQNLNDLIVPPAFHEAHNTGIAHFLKTGEAKVLNRRIEVTALRKDRTEITVELAATAIAHSEPPMFTAYLRDITKRKEADLALLRMRDELEVRVEERTAELAKTNATLQIEITEREWAEAETRTRARQQEAVAELGRRALMDIDLDTLLNGATALVAATLDVQIGSLLQLTPEGDKLSVRASTGLPKDFPGFTTPVNLNSQAGYSLLAKTPTIVHDLSEETRFEPSTLMLEQGVVSSVTVLINGYKQPFGTLGAHTTQKRLFTRDDVHFLQSMANVLAAALERRRVEGEIRQLNAQLKSTNEQLRIENVERQMALGTLKDLASGLEQAKEEAEKARENAEIANRAKSEFLSRMSHELRTPLNAIIGFGQILAMRGDDFEPQQQENIQQILKAGRHLLELINEVLDIARIEAGHLSLSPEPLAVRPLVQEVLDLVQPLALDRSIQLINEVLREEGESYVLADQQRLKQVLLNLVSNAVKYNCDGGKVVISCHATKKVPTIHGEIESIGTLRVLVRDTGSGLNSQEIDSLFVPFERLGAARTRIEGTGIGLSLCKRLTEAMNGRVGVESQVGQGSTFWIELPLVQEPSLQKAISANFVSHQKGAIADSLVSATAKDFDSPRTILCIEDNLSNINLIGHIVSDLGSNIRLLTAIQGSLGLELATQHSPDLILLDVNLPDMMGDVVLRRLKANSLTGGIPVVVLSADATSRQIEQMRSAGASHYLTKPLDVSRFLSVITELLQNSDAAPS